MSASGNSVFVALGTDFLRNCRETLPYSPVRSAVHNEPAQRILCAIVGACTACGGLWGSGAKGFP